MKPGRAIAQMIGRKMLTPMQARRASLPSVMSMFSATGLSESERLEMAIMLQRMIVEGYLRGVDVPTLMQQRQNKEGMLHFSFTDDPVLSRNTVQFDRAGWRTQAMPLRVSEFLNKVSTRLSAAPNTSQAPRTRAAVRHDYERPRTGPLRNPTAQKATEKVAQKVIAAISPAALNSAFAGLSTFQAQNGVPAPTVPDAPRYDSLAYHEQYASMIQEQTQNVVQTRRELSNAGWNVQDNLPARTGIATPRNDGMSEFVERQASGQAGRPARVLIFTNGGSNTWSTEITQTKKNLDSLGIAYDSVSSLAGVDYSKYGAVFMPGGNASYVYNISDYETTRLQQAIRAGLNYIGNCAGAFAAGGASSHLFLTDINIQYPTTTFPGGGAQVTTPVKLWNGQTRNLTFYGGPGLDAVASREGAEVLGRFTTGEAGIVRFDYGAGDVILDAFHPSVETGGDPDGSDDEIDKLLWKAILSGASPTTNPPGPTTGGTTTPPTTGGTPTTPSTPTYVQGPPTYNVAPTQVNPGTSGGTTLATDSRRRPGAARKTPVAGMLPQGFVPNTFAAGIQDVLNKSSPMLQGIAGALQGIRK